MKDMTITATQFATSAAARVLQRDQTMRFRNRNIPLSFTVNGWLF